MIKYGLIAEEQNDIDSILVLIKRISKSSVSHNHFIGHGCGKIKRKAHAWADNLKLRGCNRLILIHDLDKNNLSELHNKLHESIKPSPIDKYLICIPIQELEAWFLADGNCIKTIFNLKKNIKDYSNPEIINDPKEFLKKLVKKISNDSNYYLNTKHNIKLSQKLSIEKVKKCKSFINFYNFILKN